jgi:hypothetical protein
LCPHLRINPETKLVTPLGNNPIFWWIFVFSVAICSSFIFFLSCQSLSPQDILRDLLGLEAFVNFFFHFQKFLSSSGVLALCLTAACENWSGSHPAHRVQCEVFAPFSKVACENHSFSHCVTFLACEQSFQNFEIEFLSF